MFKKSLFVVISILLLCSFCFAQETVTITTYYPAPYGIYQQLRLNPNGSPPACNGATANDDGLLHYDNGTGGIGTAGFYYCNGTSWQSVGAGYWAVNGTNIYNTNSGNVGIGTSGPGATLDVLTTGQQGLRLQRAAGSTNLRIDAIGGDSAIQLGDGTTLGAVSKWTMGRDNTDNSFRFANSDGLGTTDRMVILDGGNVGIGTTSPATKLEVSGGNLRVVGTAQMRSNNTIEFWNTANTSSGTATIRAAASAQTCNTVCNTNLNKTCIVGVTNTPSLALCTASITGNCLCY